MIKHKKIIISILLAYALFIVGIFNVRADSAEPTTMEYYNQNGTLFSFGGPTSSTYYTIPFYTLYRTYDGLTYINAMYGQPSGVSGKYFTFYMYSTTSTFRTVSAFIQLSSGDYLSCNIDNSLSTNNIYTATCDLSSFGSSFTIYKYGFQWLPYTESTPVTTNTSQYLISKIFYFDNSNSYTSQIVQNTTNINNSINDSSIDNNNTSSSTTSWGNKNATNGTITSLLTLPISLLQAIVNGIQSSCSSFSLGSLFNTNITLPCINIGNLIGSGLWSTIDILFSGFMILAIGKKLVKIFNDFTNLKTNQVDELYGGGK